MTNQERRQLLDKFRASDMEGSILDVFKAYEQGVDLLEEHSRSQAEAENPVTLMGPQQQKEGLRPFHAAGDLDRSAVFKDVAPNTPFNTHGMKTPINIDKYNEQGHLVESHRSIPPGVSNIPTGPYRGDVIETPAKGYQTGGFKENDFTYGDWEETDRKVDPITGDTTISEKRSGERDVEYSKRGLNWDVAYERWLGKGNKGTFGEFKIKANKWKESQTQKEFDTQNRERIELGLKPLTSKSATLIEQPEISKELVKKSKAIRPPGETVIPHESTVGEVESPFNVNSVTTNEVNSRKNNKNKEKVKSTFKEDTTITNDEGSTNLKLKTVDKGGKEKYREVFKIYDSEGNLLAKDVDKTNILGNPVLRTRITGKGKEAGYRRGGVKKGKGGPAEETPALKHTWDIGAALTGPNTHKARKEQKADIMSYQVANYMTEMMDPEGKWRTESDPRAKNFIENTLFQNVGAQHADSVNTPWSAATVSHFAKTFDPDFQTSALHADYINRAFNRDGNYRVRKTNRGSYEVGDILFRGREETKDWKLKDYKRAARKGKRYASHSDIIVGTGTDEKGTYYEVIGGNRGGTEEGTQKTKLERLYVDDINRKYTGSMITGRRANIPEPRVAQDTSYQTGGWREIPESSVSESTKPHGYTKPKVPGIDYTPTTRLSRPAGFYQAPDADESKVGWLEMAANPMATMKFYQKNPQMTANWSSWDRNNSHNYHEPFRRPTKEEFGAPGQFGGKSKSAHDMALDIVNPAAWVDYAGKSLGSLAQGNVPEAAAYALGALPSVPMSSMTKPIKQTIVKGGQGAYQTGMKYAPTFTTNTKRGVDKFVNKLPEYTSRATIKPATSKIYDKFLDTQVGTKIGMYLPGHLGNRAMGRRGAEFMRKHEGRIIREYQSPEAVRRMKAEFAQARIDRGLPPLSDYQMHALVSNRQSVIRGALYNNKNRTMDESYNAIQNNRRVARENDLKGNWGYSMGPQYNTKGEYINPVAFQARNNAHYSYSGGLNIDTPLGNLSRGNKNLKMADGVRLDPLRRRELTELIPKKGSEDILNNMPFATGRGTTGQVYLGRDYMNLNTLEHELGHAWQMGGRTPLDKRLQMMTKERALTERELQQLSQGSLSHYTPKGYFMTGSQGKEAVPFGLETRQYLRDKGFLTTRHQNITGDILDQAFRKMKGKGSDVYAGMKLGSEGSRLLSFADGLGHLEKFHYFSNLAKLMNRLPVAIPAAGAAGVIATQGEKKESAI